jgi:hypothetical protein
MNRVDGAACAWLLALKPSVSFELSVCIGPLGSFLSVQRLFRASHMTTRVMRGPWDVVSGRGPPAMSTAPSPVSPIVVCIELWMLACNCDPSVLFELLASRRPFEGDNVATLAFNVREGATGSSRRVSVGGWAGKGNFALLLSVRVV